jgi:hypothetical protein
MAFATVAAVESLRVEPQHPVHHSAQLRRRRRLDDHMEVRSEHRPRQQFDAEQLRCAMQQDDERVPIHVVEENEHAARALRADVEPTRREAATRRTRHGSDGRAAPAGAPAVVTLPLQGLSLGHGR